MMQTRRENGKYIVELEGRISAENAGDVEAELERSLEGRAGEAVELDASRLAYISSAGLRVVLKLLKSLGSLTITEASPEVYEVFEMTGFTTMMDVRRALRSVSIDGCELIGQGGNGAVYRLDPERIVKVYHSASSTLDKIQESRKSAQKLLVAGIPVAIAFEVVRVGEGYGLIFELLDCTTIGSVVHENPESAEYWARRAAGLLKQLHATEMPPGTFPDARRSCHEWIDVAARFFTEDELAMLHRFCDAMPTANTLVHGDFHAGNIIVQGEELVLIDTDDVAQGPCDIDLAGLDLVYGNIRTEERAMSVVGMSLEEMSRFFRAFIVEYYGTDDAQELARHERERKIHSLLKLLYGFAKTSGLPQERIAPLAAHAHDEVLALASAAL